MGRRQQAERLRERIAEGGRVRGSISGPDQRLLEAFSDRLDLLNQTYTDERHAKRLNHTVIIAEALDDSPLDGIIRLLTLAGESVDSAIDCLVIASFRSST